MTVEALYKIERIKTHRRSLAKKRSVAVPENPSTLFGFEIRFAWGARCTNSTRWSRPSLANSERLRRKS